MSSFNKFCVIGRLTADPELKEIENGDKVVNVTLAVDKDYKDKDGNKLTDFINFALWNKTAERICAFSKKGALVCFEGSLTQKGIETEKGKINTIQLMVDSYKHLANPTKNNDNELEESKEEMEK